VGKSDDRDGLDSSVDRKGCLRCRLISVQTGANVMNRLLGRAPAVRRYCKRPRGVLLRILCGGKDDAAPDQIFPKVKALL
jgi:hypothetical protein